MSDATNPIPRVTRDDPAAHSGDVVGENIAALKALFPAIVTDGKVDFDVLRQLLGDAVDDGAERYGLNWKGKAKARAFALTPSLGTLRPAKEDSVDWDTTKNIMIEGDNLEVLKLLRKSYERKVKVIYIDPPYNTGKDFVYPDNYTESLATYEALTGQRGEDGAALTSNKDTSGRFHTDWLNMMYARLMLAKDLLSDDGVIFVNIDGGEVSRLDTVLEQIFGEENHQGHAIWQKKYAVSSDAKRIPPLHDHILIYSKTSAFIPGMLPRSAKQDDIYKNPDNDPRGRWRSDNLLRAEYRERDRYEIVSPLTGQRHLPPLGQSWRHPEAQMLEMIKDNRVWFGTDGTNKPAAKRFLSEVRDGVVASSWWSHEIAGHNDQSKKELQALFDGASPFDTPKPVKLLQHILMIAGDPQALVVDFFAGSGTTGHAVTAQNAADGGNRRYILVQLPERLDPDKKEQKTATDFCDKLGKPRNIAELTKERLRRAGAQVKASNPDAQVDAGFSVYKLATSNLKPWQPGNDLQADLLDATGNILPGRSEDDLLVELLLKTGIDLAMPSQSRTIAGRTVHLFGGGTLIVCLADIPADQARPLADGIADWLAEVSPPDKTTFFFKDSGFDPGGTRATEARANLAATLRQRLGDDAIEKLGAI